MLGTSPREEPPCHATVKRVAQGSRSASAQKLLIRDSEAVKDTALLPQPGDRVPAVALPAAVLTPPFPTSPTPGAGDPLDSPGALPLTFSYALSDRDWLG